MRMMRCLICVVAIATLQRAAWLVWVAGTPAFEPPISATGVWSLRRQPLGTWTTLSTILSPKAEMAIHPTLDHAEPQSR